MNPSKIIARSPGLWGLSSPLSQMPVTFFGPGGFRRSNHAAVESRESKIDLIHVVGLGLQSLQQLLLQPLLFLATKSIVGGLAGQARESSCLRCRRCHRAAAVAAAGITCFAWPLRR